MATTTNPLYGNQKATAANLDVWLVTLQERVTKMEAEILAKDTIIATLNEKVSNLEKSNVKAMDWSKIFTTNKKSTPEEVVFLAKVAQEAKDKSNKEFNVVLNGVKEKSGTGTLDERHDHDKLETNKILTAISMDHTKVKNIYRAKKKQNSQTPGIIIVEFHEKEDQIKALKQAKALKEIEDFKNIYINKDLTIAEAQFEKELRTVRDKKNGELTLGEGRLKYGVINNQEYYWGIRWGTVKKINRTTNKPLTNQNY